MHQYPFGVRKQRRSPLCFASCLLQLYPYPYISFGNRCLPPILSPLTFGFLASYLTLCLSFAFLAPFLPLYFLRKPLFTLLSCAFLTPYPKGVRVQPYLRLSSSQGDRKAKLRSPLLYVLSSISEGVRTYVPFQSTYANKGVNKSYLRFPSYPFGVTKVTGKRS